ncbi:unnamed protein product [Gongylonema pulchrum]|uniref:GST C-terminal domain-containing protein n=1 Tax=Gongylonema pulchrum TaxID=637853 RepID=A0A183D649_9BILA|nr:unnamed protein product [Gongylonema pulchrum]
MFCKLGGTNKEIGFVFRDGVKFTNDAAIARFITRWSNKADELFGRDLLEQLQIDWWVVTIEQHIEYGRSLDRLFKLAEKNLTVGPHLCFNRFTLADIMLWTVIADDEEVSFYP